MEEPADMTETQTIQLPLTPDELQLVRTALRLLLSTLGRKEAEEMAEVQAILAQIDATTR
jgi:hypothetical protein